MGYLEDRGYLPRPSWSSFGRYVASPYKVLDVIRISYPMFRGVFQHDSQEFMRAFLGDLHDEIKFKPFDDSKFPCSPNPPGCSKCNDTEYPAVNYNEFI